MNNDNGTAKDYKNGYGDCEKCGKEDVMLIDTSDSGWTEYDELCGHCIKKRGDRVHERHKEKKRRESDLSDERNTRYEGFW